MALGARRRGLLWLVLREVLGTSVAGLAIGLPVTFAAANLVQSFLFEMKPHDPVTLAPAALLAAALAAGYGPAWRASRVDPWSALRDE